MAGYHIETIPRGIFGEFSKVEEEFRELKDAFHQGNRIMVLNECCDLIGAIEAYVVNHSGMTLDDLLTMKEATERAFQDGTRQAK